MQHSNNPKRTTAIIALLMALTLSACGGQKLNRKPLENQHQPSLLRVANQHLEVTILDVLVSNDPVSWVKNARWDEYLIQLKTRGVPGIEVQTIRLMDSIGGIHEPQYQRRQLNRSFRKIKNDHQRHDLHITIGQRHDTTRTLLASSSMGAMAATTSSSAYLSGAASAGAGAVVVAVPALLVTGIVRTVNHHQVQQVLDQKAISFPLNLDDPDRRWSLIYPATPAPQTLAIEYRLHDQPHVLMIDLTQALPGLHLKSPSI